MDSDGIERSGVAVLTDLIRFLHQGASSEQFFAQIARVEQLDLPASERSSLTECIRMSMAVGNRLELQQQREHGFLAVIESARDLSSHLDPMGLLHAIVTRARTLLGAHVAWISVFNAEANEMQVRVTDGAIFGETARMTMKKGLGAGSVIYATKMPFTTSDYLSDQRFEHDPKLDIVFRKEGVAALVGVPMVLENEVIGLLFVADRYHRSHSALEISILSTLATHAAVAMNTANKFDLAHQALQKGDHAREALERHVRNVQTASEAHEQLTGMLAHGATLPTVCDALARQLKASVLVLDEAMQVIAGSPAVDQADSARFAPYDHHRVEIEQAARESRRMGRSVIAYSTASEGCWVVPVTSGSEVVGSLALFAPADVNEVALHIFEQSASVVGIVLLSHERSELHRGRDAAALIRALLMPHQYESASTPERAEQFGLDLAAPLSLLLIGSDALNAVYMARQLRALVTSPGVAVDEIDDVVAVVCRAPAALEVAQTCTRFLAARLQVEHLGVLSNPMAAAKLPALYSSLRRALLVAKRMGTSGILKQAELTLYAMLFETQDATSIDAFLESSIGTLLSHDRRKKSELATTLLCYFEASRNIRSVAKRMNIHVNTVRQRLVTTEKLLGRINPSRELEVHIALRLWALKRGEQVASPEPEPAAKTAILSRR